jgi:hypothetical protein
MNDDQLNALIGQRLHDPGGAFGTPLMRIGGQPESIARWRTCVRR